MPFFNVYALSHINMKMSESLMPFYHFIKIVACLGIVSKRNKQKTGVTGPHYSVKFRTH